MAVTSARNIVDMKEKGHFERDNARIDKYTLADELPKQLSELDLHPRTMEKPSYSLHRITLDDKDLVLKFLRRFFFRDEPMNLAMKLLETPEARCLELEEYVISTVEDLISIAVVDEHGEFVGVVLNGIARREEADYDAKSEEPENPKYLPIHRMLCHLEREGKMWEKVPKDCHTILEVRIASTHSAWRGRGLMRVMCEESERLARSIGAGAMRMDTTSAFSAAAAERLNYKQVYGVRYADLEFAPQPKPPHVEARVYIKELV